MGSNKTLPICPELRPFPDGDEPILIRCPAAGQASGRSATEHVAAHKKNSDWLFLCCFALLSALDAEFIGDVVLKDVAHELHGFAPDSLCGH